MFFLILNNIPLSVCETLNHKLSKSNFRKSRCLVKVEMVMYTFCNTNIFLSPKEYRTDLLLKLSSYYLLWRSGSLKMSEVESRVIAVSLSNQESQRAHCSMETSLKILQDFHFL